VNNSWWQNNVGNKTFFERVLIPPTIGARVQYQPNNRELNSLVVSVMSGGVRVWFGLVDGEGTPDMHFGHFNTVVHVPLPAGTTSLTFVAIGPATPAVTVLVGCNGV
jgi:hypothetical protein